MDQWYYCVEVNFDGTKTNLPTWFIDGQEAQYYMGEPNNPTKPQLITPVRPSSPSAFTSYAGPRHRADALRQRQGPGHDRTCGLDDIAFDTKRIGCIAK